MAAAAAKSRYSDSSDKKLDLVLAAVQGLTIKLFGDVNTENERGRLPQLETKVDDHANRITRLENWVVRIGGGLVVVVVIWQIVSTFLKH